MLNNLQEKFGHALKVLSGQAKIRPQHIEEALQEIRTSLLDADVNYDVVDRFLSSVKEKAVGTKVAESLSPYQQFVKILSTEMLNILGKPEELDLSFKPPVIIFLVGLQGSGKTTSAGKLALFAKRKLKRKPLLVSVDVQRPAAIEQLKRLASDAKVDYSNSASMEPLVRAREALKYASTYGLDLLIVDTAGRLSIDEALMGELEDLRKELNPQHVFFVADAMSGQQGLKVAEGFSDRVGLTGVVLTKADADTRGGIAFSIREALKVPLRFVGGGEKLEAFEPFHPDRWVSRILGLGDVMSLIEKAEEAVSESGQSKEELESKAKKMMKGDLSLRDFQEQMKMMSKMGSLGGLIGMIPGMSQMAQKIDSEAIETKMKRIDAMINSMTIAERDNPDLLNGSRRKRIANGSGTQVEELNQFIREFEDMRKLMKRFSGAKGMRGLGSMLGNLKGARFPR